MRAARCGGRCCWLADVARCMIDIYFMRDCCCCCCEWLMRIFISPTGSFTNIDFSSAQLAWSNLGGTVARGFSISLRFGPLPFDRVASTALPCIEISSDRIACRTGAPSIGFRHHTQPPHIPYSTHPRHPPRHSPSPLPRVSCMHRIWICRPRRQL